MDIFGILSMIGGLALFLYGMEAMGAGLSKLSGGRMERLLEKLTSKRIMAVLLGAGVTAVIQSSSGNNSNGCWFCKLRDYETESGCRHYYGCEYWYNHHILAVKSYRDSGKQLYIKNVKAIFIFPYSCYSRHNIYYVYKR